MAFPVRLETQGIPIMTRDSGIVIALFEGHPDFRREIQRAPDVAGEPNEAAAEFVAEVPGTERSYTDRLPVDGQWRWYRQRAVRDGYEPSAWTCWRRAKPVWLPLILPEPAAIAPVIGVETDESATLGTVRITVVDPQCRLVAVEFRTQVGTNPPSAWTPATESSPGLYVQTVARSAEQRSVIRYRYSYYDALGVLQTVADEKAFGLPSLGAASRLRAEVDVEAATADVFLLVSGPQVLFPVSAEIYQDDPTSTPIATHDFAAASEIGPEQYPSLGGIELPKIGSVRWWAKLEDALGRTAWVFTMADRDSHPGGSVTADDFREKPSLRCEFDDDVEEIVIYVPGGNTKTFDALSGGGLAIYQVGTTPLDDSSLEDEFEEGESRNYVVEYRGGGATVVMWNGPLHGPVGPGGPTVGENWLRFAGYEWRSRGPAFLLYLSADVGEDVRSVAVEYYRELSNGTVMPSPEGIERINLSPRDIDNQSLGWALQTGLLFDGGTRRVFITATPYDGTWSGTVNSGEVGAPASLTVDAPGSQIAPPGGVGIRAEITAGGTAAAELMKPGIGITTAVDPTGKVEMRVKPDDFIIVSEDPPSGVPQSGVGTIWLRIMP